MCGVGGKKAYDGDLKTSSLGMCLFVLYPCSPTHFKNKINVLWSYRHIGVKCQE